MLSVHFSQLPSKVSRLLVNSRSLYPKLLKIYPKGPTWSQTSALASHSPAGPFLHWPSLAKGWEEGNTCLLLSCKHHDHPLFWLPPLVGQELLTFPIGNTSHLTGKLGQTMYKIDLLLIGNWNHWHTEHFTPILDEFYYMEKYFSRVFLQMKISVDTSQIRKKKDTYLQQLSWWG